MNFFFDNNLPPPLARAINELMGDDGDAIHLKDKFEANIKDIDWIPKLAEEGHWIIISRDYHITQKPHERRAWQQARLTAFFLKKGWSRLDLWTQAAKLVKWWPDIMAQAERVAPGAGFYVPVQYNGTFEQVRLT